MSEDTTRDFPSRQRQARAELGRNVAAAVVGVFVATLIELLVINRYEPKPSAPPPEASTAAAAPSSKSGTEFDVRQRILPDELSPEP